MRFALLSKDSDDLSVTISMGENYQKSRAKCSSEGQFESKIVNLHSNNEDEALKCKSHQNGSRVEKSKFQTYRCISQSKNSSDGTWTFSASRSFFEGIVS